MGVRKEGLLHPLSQSEILQKMEALHIKESQGEYLISVPLEAGFDLATKDNSSSLVDKMNQYNLKNWMDMKLPQGEIEEIKCIAQQQFRTSVQQWLKVIQQKLPKNIESITFAHTMAGGVPRSKLAMAVLNRVVKGTGKRFLSSKEFCEETDLGKACLKNFNEVTAESYRILIEETQKAKNEFYSNPSINYIAYGYHGNFIFLNGKYEWRGYAPYIQGWAKLNLENIAKTFHKDKKQVTVFNCPEVLTRSSQAFSGLEVFLYSFINSIFSKEQKGNPIVKNIKTQHQFDKFFTDGAEEVQTLIEYFFNHPSIKEQTDIKLWPQHNSPKQMELMIESSSAINNLVVPQQNKALNHCLSQTLIQLTGKHIFEATQKKTQAVEWLSHKDLLLQ